LIIRTGLANLYSGPWLLLPVILLALNLSACLLKGLPQAVHRVATSFSWEAAAVLPERGRFSWPAGIAAPEVVAAAVRGELGRYRHLKTPGREIFLCEKGRFRPLGPYFIHLGLLLILLGALVGKFWGVEGRLLVHEGEVANSFEAVKPQGERPLPCAVRLDRFQVEFYPQSSIPAEFRSDLTFLRHGLEVGRAVCRVNEPVTWEGLTFYQSSYGAEATGPLSLAVCRGSLCLMVEAQLRQRVALPGGEAQLLVIRVDGNLQGLGPAAQLAYKDGPGHPRIFWISLNHPQLADQPASPFTQPPENRIILKSLPFRWYSVFQVKRDPGVWYVYGGFLLFLPGFLMSFFLPWQRWAVVLEKAPDGHWQGRLLGASPRARESFEARRLRLLNRLQSERG